jgi:hypothetical protein
MGAIVRIAIQNVSSRLIHFGDKDTKINLIPRMEIHNDFNIVNYQALRQYHARVEMDNIV